MDIVDLTNELNKGRHSSRSRASCVWMRTRCDRKARALGLTEHPGKRIRMVR